MNQIKSDKGTLTGKITDKHTGRPLYDVEVRLPGQNKTVKTDIRGRFQIAGLQPGECTVDCYLGGYRKPSQKSIAIASGVVGQISIKLESQQKVSLNEPVVLLPLKLEIRKLQIGKGPLIHLAEFEKSRSKGTKGFTKNQFNFKQTSQIKPLDLTEPEYWIRWYPDDIQILTPVGQITAQEKEDWHKLFEVYLQQKSKGSVYQLHVDDLYTLTNEELEIFYGFKPGKLSPNKLLKCKEYDEDARQRIKTEGEGVREGLGWQDLENPKLKLAWIEFSDKYGIVRARQIARFCTGDDNWDFDIKFPIHIDGSYQSEFDNGELSDTLRENIRNQFKINFSNNAAIEIEEQGKKWKINDIEEGATYSANLVENVMEIDKISGDGSEALDLLIEHGIPLPSLPEEVNLYTVKDRKLELLNGIHIVREEVSFGPGDLQSNKWMTDFQEAIRVGMGIRIQESQKVQKIDDADWLIAVGINETSDSRKVMEELLRRNNASGEFSILAQDTPTNNTDNSQTRYQELETDIEEYLRKTRIEVEIQTLADDVCDEMNQKILDTQKLQQIFKLDKSSVSEMEGANLADMTEATAMASLLWKPCTEVAKKNIGMPIDFDQLEEFFVNNVRARGILPIIRMGENPYGLLPAASLRNYFDSPPDNWAVNNLHGWINRVKDVLISLSQDSPKIDLSFQDNLYETLETILQTTAVSSRVKIRDVEIAEGPFGPPILLPDEDPQLLKCALVKEKNEQGTLPSDILYPETSYLHDFCKEDFDPECFLISEDSPLLKRILKYLLHIEHGVEFHSSPPGIAGTVTNSTNGEPVPNAKIALEGTLHQTATDRLGKYMIANVAPGAYTVEVNAKGFYTAKRTGVSVAICKQNEVNFNLNLIGIKPKDTPQFELRTRLGSGIVDILEESNSIGPAKNEIKGIITKGNSNEPVAGVMVRLEGADKMAMTDLMGRYNFDDLPDGVYKVSATHGDDANFTFAAKVGSSLPIVEYISPLQWTLPDDKCDRHKAAAKLLKDVHPDKLEILLLETLDLFTYRFDAWLTGLANEQLLKNQSQNTQSPPTGVFGWLEKPGQLDLTSSESEYIQAPSLQQASTAAILRNASIHNGTSDNSGAFQINMSSDQVRKGLWYFEGLRQGHLPGELLGYRLERLIYEESKKRNSRIQMANIFDLREQYPLPIQETIDEDGNNTSILTIIDGEAFLRENTESKYEYIKNQLNRIKDAAADIALCEVIDADSNPERRGGWLDFLDGEALPPQEEFVRTHRSGIIHGTKVFLPIPAPENVIAPDSVTNPRILADPILAHFCRTLMPEFESKEIVVEVSNKQGTKTRPITFFAEELEIEPIDLVIGGEEELILRVRSYILSCWKQNDPDDLTISSPCNILGVFPNFDETDEQRNEVAIKIIRPQNDEDQLNIYSYINKANSIRLLLHKNQSKSSGATVHPEELYCIQKEQLEKLDTQQSIHVLSQRLKQIISLLINHITDLVHSSGEFMKCHMVFSNLHPVRNKLQTTGESYESGGDYQNAILELSRILTNLSDTDSYISELMVNYQVGDLIEKLKKEDASTEDIALVFETFKTNLLNIEKLYAAHLAETTKTMLSDSGIRLQEIGQFGIDEAYTIFPEKPTVAGSQKIHKIITSMLSSLISKVTPLIQDSPILSSHLHFLKVFYQHTSEINEVLRTHQIIDIHEKLLNRLPVSRQHTEILDTITFHGFNFFEPLKATLLREIETLAGGFELDSSAKDIDEIISLLQQATDKEGIVVLTPYFLSKSNEDFPKWHIDFSNLNQLNRKGHLEEYLKVRPALANLFSIYQDTRIFKLYEDKKFQSTGEVGEFEELPPEQQGNMDFIYLSKEQKFETEFLTFLLVDEWQDGIPNPVETTAIAVRYDVPQSEAPNSCIIATSPIYEVEAQYWNNDLLANTLYEVIELMQIRALSSNEIISSNILGNLLPALLFAREDEEAPLFPIKELLFTLKTGLSSFAFTKAASMGATKTFNTENFGVRSISYNPGDQDG